MNNEGKVKVRVQPPEERVTNFKEVELGYNDEEALKEEGAKQYPNDIERYIEHKSPFIKKIYAEIGI